MALILVLAAAVAAYMVFGHVGATMTPPLSDPTPPHEPSPATPTVAASGTLPELPRRRLAVPLLLRMRGDLPSQPAAQEAVPDSGDGRAALEVAAAADESQTPSGTSREPDIFKLLRNHRDHPVSPKVTELAREITKDATNNVTKARAIYDWLTANIKYDTREWENIVSGATDYIHDHDPDTVLERGTTVCIGYAWLFDDLCEAAGIESTFLIGDVRGYRGTPDDELVSSVRHAWSAVRDEDGWKLLDATWGARQDGEGESDYKWRADYYYGTDPGQFVFEHLPEEESWQLLENPVPTKSAFSMLPNLKPSFFTDGLSLGERYTSVLGASRGARHRLSVGKPASVDVAFTLSTAGGGESKRLQAVVTDGGGAAMALIPPLDRGDYLLRVYSRKGSGPYSCGADFAIKVE